jgi:hypothetical protein
MDLTADITHPAKFLFSYDTTIWQSGAGIGNFQVAIDIQSMVFADI